MMMMLIMMVTVTVIVMMMMMMGVLLLLKVMINSISIATGRDTRIHALHSMAWHCVHAMILRLLQRNTCIAVIGLFIIALIGELAQQLDSLPTESPEIQ